MTQAQVKLNYENNKTPTYEEIIHHYQKLDEQLPFGKLTEAGKTDSGKPLHLFIISKDQDFDSESIQTKDKRVILINNGIHPGEPCGIDASLKYIIDLSKNPDELPENTVICIIPVYNVGGAIHRNSFSRANQNGPEAYGFRGNAKNLDLNRDFVKCDSENAKSFTAIFQTWKPDVFIDTHTSNGADYQYVMTLITTQHNKLSDDLAELLNKDMLPAIYKDMETAGYEMCPYVNVYNKPPDDGFTEFLDTPRYSTGYASLFNTIGFTTEAHMFKPYKDRVLSTHEFIKSVTRFTTKNAEKIGQLKQKSDEETARQKEFTLAWKLDTASFKTINFKGYEARRKPSTVTGKERIFYDRSAPFEKQIKYFNTYKSAQIVQKPGAYIIPQAWTEVIERLQLNGVEIQKLKDDTQISCTVYYITDFKTIETPFESHYLHYDVTVRTEIQKLQFYTGDIVIKTDQVTNKYIIEMLEPQGPDSFFSWNFFDEILQQKEGFSPYVFEEIAEKLLQEDSKLKKEFEAAKKSDAALADDPIAQLTFIYKKSPHYEKSHLRYPVARIETQLNTLQLHD